MQLLVDGTVLEVNRDVTELRTLATRQGTLARDLSTAAAKFEALFNQTVIFAGIMDLQGSLREANDLALEYDSIVNIGSIVSSLHFSNVVPPAIMKS